MRTLLRTLAYSLAAILVALGAVALWERKSLIAIIDNWDVIRAGAKWTQSAESPDALVDYLAAFPDRVSLAVWTVGDEAHGASHRADELRPLASTVKVAVLATWADAVAQGEADPNELLPVSAWDDLHLPGTDGGAHERATKELQSEHALDDGSVAWSQVAHAMVAFSDNAAADLLMRKLGPDRLARSTRAHLGDGAEVPFPLNGAFLLAAPDGTAETPAQKIQRVAQLPRDQLAARAWEALLRLATDAAFRTSQQERLQKEGIGIGLKDQLAYAQVLTPRGTARAYAQLMAEVVTAPEDSAWAEVMSKALEWPSSQTFARLGTKGGSLPGVLTSAYYAVPKDGPPRVLALFLSDVPLSLWAKLMQRYTQQEVERRLLTDPAFAHELSARLSGATKDAGH